MLIRALRRTTPRTRIIVALVITVVIASSVSIYRLTHPTLSLGVNSSYVVDLQVLLRDNGHARYFNATTDRSFGEVTARALFNWEADNKDRHSVVKIDGTITVGDDEWQLLESQKKPVSPSDLSAQCTPRKDRVVVCADKSKGKIWLFSDSDLRLEADARFGSAEYPTREGIFKATRLEERSWSVPYSVVMPFSVYFSGGEAIHYSQQFENKKEDEAVGASAGCINLKDYEKARWVFDWFTANGGGTVIVYDSPK